MNKRILHQIVKSLVFRRRMAETLHELEDDIRTSLLKEQKEEMATGGFKISIKEGGQIAITELPPLNLEQLRLPLVIEPDVSQKGAEKCEKQIEVKSRKI